MKNWPNIFYLIHALTPNEKGYFKKFGARSGNRESVKYLELFDLLSSQEAYDEEKLKKKIKDQRLLKNLSAEKKYLYNHVLDSLSFSGSQSENHEKILGLLINVRVLFHKSLYSLVRERLDKIYKICELGCFYELHLEALSLELSVWQYLKKDERRELQEIFNNRAELLQNISNVDASNKLSLEVVWNFTLTGVARSTEVVKQNEEWLLLCKSYIESEKKIPCKRARINNLNTMVFLLNSLDRMEETQLCLKELINVLETVPILREEYMNLYASSLSNYILVSFHKERLNDGEIELEKLRNLKATQLRSQLAVFVSRMNAEFEYFKRTRNIKQACDLANEMKTEFLKLESLIPFHYSVHLAYFSFRAYFYCGKYKEALFWINYLTNSGKEITREDAASITRISEIMLHYEMGNSEIVLSLTKSAQRFLEKKNSLFMFEKVMLEFFKAIYNEKDTNLAFIELRKKLEPIFQDDLEGRVKAYFDFDAWIEAKIHNLNIAEYLSRYGN